MTFNEHLRYAQGYRDGHVRLPESVVPDVFHKTFAGEDTDQIRGVAPYGPAMDVYVDSFEKHGRKCIDNNDSTITHYMMEAYGVPLKSLPGYVLQMLAPAGTTRRGLSAI